MQDERFRLEKRTYDSQYAPIYFCRLELMTPLLLARIAQQWPGVPVSKILDLPEGQEVAVVGTVYKEMKLKPSILDEYNKARLVSAGLIALGTTLPTADCPSTPGSCRAMHSKLLSRSGNSRR